MWICLTKISPHVTAAEDKQTDHQNWDECNRGTRMQNQFMWDKYQFWSRVTPHWECLMATKSVHNLQIILNFLHQKTLGMAQLRPFHCLITYTQKRSGKGFGIFSRHLQTTGVFDLIKLWRRPTKHRVKNCLWCGSSILFKDSWFQCNSWEPWQCK